ncbi:hypothetical protein PR001_g10828 [Phytophthora rubi]|uniref:Uncharacterized protein n=1 Tax=Phytophthora rubi TaxID=129364 RepID=A0A6A3MLY1_9STRA|nr:hypothetical protein PR001_g10828 [Phytophthora rubi]
MSKPESNQKSSYTPETMSPKSTTSSTPESGTSDEFLEFEGTTSFAPAPCTTQLSLEDYVNSTNAIPNATALDYVTLLEGAKDDLDHIRTTFQRHKGEVFQLEVSVKLQVLKQSRVATYCIEMEPISLERIDVLESKMRDLQDEVEVIANHSRGLQDLEVSVKLLQDDVDAREKEFAELKKQFMTLGTSQDTTTLVQVQVQATTKVADWICWNNNADDIIRTILPGLYHVTAVVNYKSKSTNAAIQLMKGAECIQTAYCGFTDGYCSSTTLACTTRVEKNQQFAVKCPVSLTGMSFLTIVRLGK